MRIKASNLTPFLLGLTLIGCGTNKSSTSYREKAPETVEENDNSSDDDLDVAGGDPDLMDPIYDDMLADSDNTDGQTGGTGDSDGTGDSTGGSDDSGDTTTTTGGATPPPSEDGNDSGEADVASQLSAALAQLEQLEAEKAALEAQIADQGEGLDGETRQKWLDLFRYIFNVDDFSVLTVLKNDIAEVEAQIAAIQADIDALMAQISSKEGEIVAMEAEAGAYMADLNTLLAQLEALTEPTAEDTQLIDKIKTYLAGVANLATLESVRDGARTTLEAAQAAFATINAEKTFLETRIAYYEGVLADKTSELDATDDAEARIPIMDLIQAVRELADIDRADLVQVQTQVDAAQSAQDAAQVTFDSAQAAVTAQTDDNAQALADLEMAKQDEMAALSAEIASHKSELQTLLDEKGAKMTEKATAEANLARLQELLKTYEEVSSL